eukprot:TRINITY_DN3699_c0_g2_i6.p1 TRINITY_DN3699_c0_g2~~TRINITY_DN3699_c0_g2_i6.p1  ORF type:complete len:617 (-),score=113.20 TRINITY_DN3699_c0_g2_i6:373-2223(-)
MKLEILRYISDVWILLRVCRQWWNLIFRFYGLTAEQGKVLEHVISGKNVFFTGSAGTGKSFVIKKIKKALLSLKCHGDESIFSCRVALTAPTGVAAVNIGGQTIHSWAGIGHGQSSKQMKGAWKKTHRAQWRKTRVLIIDEISMMSSAMFHRLEELAKSIRNDKSPFGGLQIVLSGDFLQLQPVIKGISNSNFHSLNTANSSGSDELLFIQLEKKYFSKPFVFQADKWDEVIGGNVVHLTQIFRQSEDHEWMEILQQIRCGRVSMEASKRLSKTTENDLEDVIRIYPLNSQVTSYNNHRLNQLNTPISCFTSHDWYTIESPSNETSECERILSNLLNQCLAEKQIGLKIGCKVILLFNINQRLGLVNGSQGIVESWVDVNTCNTKELERFKVFPEAQNWFFANKTVPQVRFENGRVEVIFPVVFSSRVAIGQSYRAQVPLKPAYALTIHKCQGLTLSCAAIDLSASFTEGQAYVALSRVKSLSGLKLLSGISESNVRVNSEALRFYQQLTQEPSASGKETQACLDGQKVNRPVPCLNPPCPARKSFIPHVSTLLPSSRPHHVVSTVNLPQKHRTMVVLSDEESEPHHVVSTVNLPQKCRTVVVLSDTEENVQSKLV